MMKKLLIAALLLSGCQQVNRGEKDRKVKELLDSSDVYLFKSFHYARISTAYKEAGEMLNRRGLIEISESYHDSLIICLSKAEYYKRYSKCLNASPAN